MEFSFTWMLIHFWLYQEPHEELQTCTLIFSDPQFVLTIILQLTLSVLAVKLVFYAFQFLEALLYLDALCYWLEWGFGRLMFQHPCVSLLLSSSSLSWPTPFVIGLVWACAYRIICTGATVRFSLHRPLNMLPLTANRYATSNGNCITTCLMVVPSPLRREEIIEKKSMGDESSFCLLVRPRRLCFHDRRIWYFFLEPPMWIFLHECTSHPSNIRIWPPLGSLSMHLKWLGLH